MSSHIELITSPIKRYKSLPNNLSEIDSESFFSINPLNESNDKKKCQSDDNDKKNNIEKNNPSLKDKLIELFQRIKNNYVIVRFCEEFKLYFPYILHYYTHLIFIIVFEIIFYFKYVTTIEKKLIKNMITKIVNTFVQIYFNNNPNAENNIFISQQLVTEICDNYSSPSNQHNDLIYEKCLIIIIILLCVFTLILLVGSQLYNIKLVANVLLDSLCLIFFLGIFEYCFFEYIVLGYQITSAGEVACIGMNTVYTYLNKHNN
jgi:hypothetical protein